MSCRFPRVRGTFIIVQALWGLALVLAPAIVLAFLGGPNEGRMPKRVMRVLGARHLMQACGERCIGGRAFELGAWADGLHAVTGVDFGYLDARWRRAALTDAAITAGFAAFGLATRPRMDAF
jgi:hypothetical protein